MDYSIADGAIFVIKGDRVSKPFKLDADITYRNLCGNIQNITANTQCLFWKVNKNIGSGYVHGGRHLLRHRGRRARTINRCSKEGRRE